MWGIFLFLAEQWLLVISTSYIIKWGKQLDISTSIMVHQN